MTQDSGNLTVTIEVDGMEVSKEDVKTPVCESTERLNIEKAVKQCLEREIWHLESVQALLASGSVKRSVKG